MTLTELRYVVALGRERHFGRAAERCFVSQPTLSVALRKLEDELGVTLFERQHGEVAATAIGEAVIEQARKVLHEAAQITTLAQRGQDELAGRLRLGAIYTVGPYLLPNLVPRLSGRAPNMPLVIEENFTVELSRRLRQSDVDIIIVAEPFSLGGVRTWPVYDESFVVVVPRNHPWAEREAIAAPELAGENLLLLGSGHCFRDQVIAACPGCERGDEDAEPLAGSSLETIRHMVASGLGITVLPQTSVDHLANENDSLLVTRPFSGRGPSRRITLAWRRSYPRMQAVEALREAILQSGQGGVTMLPDAIPSD